MSDVGEYLEQAGEVIWPIRWAIIVSFAVTAAAIPVLRPLAIRIGLVDHPNHRKRHAGSVPLVGGMAMFLGFLFGLLVTEGFSLTHYRSFVAGAMLLIIVGVLDDLRELSARKKFAAQIVAIIFMVSWGDVTVVWVGDLVPGQNPFLGNWSLPFTFIAAIAVINAVNMSDGMDGLAGGYVLIALVAMVLLACASPSLTEAKLLSVLIGSVVAFMAFNMRFPWRKGALVFMGDSGSMFLGFVLVWFSIVLSQGGDRAMNPVIALWIMALPLFDVVGVTLRRLIRGKPVFTADREHFHHVFEAAGWSRGLTVCILLLLASGFAAVGIFGQIMKINDRLMFFAFLGMFMVYFIGILHSWRVMKMIKRR